MGPGPGLGPLLAWAPSAVCAGPRPGPPGGQTQLNELATTSGGTPGPAAAAGRAGAGAGPPPRLRLLESQIGHIHIFYLSRGVSGSLEKPCTITAH